MLRRAAATALALALLGLAATGCDSLGRAELERGVESIGALAAQGRLLAGGVARDDTKLAFTRAMSRTLGEQAQHEAEKLADTEAQEGFDSYRRLAVGLAGKVADDFSTLQTFAGDEARGEIVLRRMEANQAAADAIVARIEAVPE